MDVVTRYRQRQGTENEGIVFFLFFELNSLQGFSGPDFRIVVDILV